MIYPHILQHGAIAGVTGPCHQLRIDAQHSLLVDIEALVRVYEAHKPLSFVNLLTVDSNQPHLSIVIAAGGMCVHVVDYLKFIQHDSRHGVLFVGCQAQSATEYSIQVDGSADGYVLLNDVSYNVGAKNMYHYWLPTSNGCWIL